MWPVFWGVGVGGGAGSSFVWCDDDLLFIFKITLVQKLYIAELIVQCSNLYGGFVGDTMTS